jgi:hypothetical protein
MAHDADVRSTNGDSIKFADNRLSQAALVACKFKWEDRPSYKNCNRNPDEFFHVFGQPFNRNRSIQARDRGSDENAAAIVKMQHTSVQGDPNPREM